MILKYFKKIKEKIQGYDHIVSDSSITEKTYSDELGYINGQLNFSDESRLEFGEVKNAKKPEKEKYSYHYMNAEDEMEFRYDNAKHHPELETFPHHKHTSDGILPSHEPDIEEVLDEIERFVVKDE